MKINFLKITLVFLFLFGTATRSSAQFTTSLLSDPWRKDQLIMPETLAGIIQKKEKIKIYNIGVVRNIKGALNIGAASESENLERLKKSLENSSKDEFIVIYCGCCPMDKCPNIRPAFKLFQEQKFTNVHVLNLPVNIKVDWVNKGYPVE